MRPRFYLSTGNRWSSDHRNCCLLGSQRTAAHCSTAQHSSTARARHDGRRGRCGCRRHCGEDGTNKAAPHGRAFRIRLACACDVMPWLRAAHTVRCMLHSQTTFWTGWLPSRATESFCPLSMSLWRHMRRRSWTCKRASTRSSTFLICRRASLLRIYLSGAGMWQANGIVQQVPGGSGREAGSFPGGEGRHCLGLLPAVQRGVCRTACCAAACAFGA